MTPRAVASRTPALSRAVQYAVAAATLPTRAQVRRWVCSALATDARVTVRFVGTREGRMLNGLYRGKDYATNVLTFVYDDVVPLTGDVVLCAPVLRREAKTLGKPLTAHCAHLVVHGMLHLQGYAHDTDRAARTMEAHETSVLEGLGVPDPYARQPAAAPGARRRA
jgi:probable rRNA maturation factor